MPLYPRLLIEYFRQFNSMKTFKLLIATTGGFTDYELMAGKLDTLLVARHPEVEVVIGFSLAGDQIGRQYAGQHGYPVHVVAGGFLRMDDMVSYSDGAAIAWDGVSKGTGALIERVRAAGKPCKVVRFEAVKVPRKTAEPKGVGGGRSKLSHRPASHPRGSVVIDGEVLIPETKKKAKPKKSTAPIDPSWRKKFQTAHEQWFAKEYPSAHRDGHYNEPNYPDPRTTNGITSIVINVLKWYGHYSNRQNVMGRQIGGITKTASGAKIDDRKWIKSSTRKGSSDVMAAIAGKMICIEIKNAITKDTIKKDQDKERKRVEQSGALYVVITSVTGFFAWYEGYMANNYQQGDIFTP